MVEFHRGGAKWLGPSTVTAAGGEGFLRLLGVYSGRVHPDSDIGVVWKLAALTEIVDSIQSA